MRAWFVQNGDKEDVELMFRTLMPHKRGAINNWLLCNFGITPLDHWTDDYIFAALRLHVVAMLRLLIVLVCLGI